MVVWQSQHNLFPLNLGAKVIEASHELVVHEYHWHGIPIILLAQPFQLLCAIRSCCFHIGVLPLVLLHQFLGVTAVRAIVCSVYDNLHQEL